MLDMKMYIRIQKMIWNIVPKSAFITTLATIITGIMPGFLSYNVSLIISNVIGKEDLNSTFLYLTFLILYYTLDTVIQSMNQVALNAGIFEEFNLKLRSALCDKRTRLALINYEDTNFLEDLNKAQNAINEEEVSMSFLISLKFLEAIVSLLTISIVLFRFNPFLCLIAFISSLPVLINRIIRGKNFASVRNKQLDDQRKANIYKRWFYKEPYCRELRIYAVSDYIKDKWSKLDLKNRFELEKFHVKDYRQFSFCNLLKSIGLVLSIYLTLLLSINGKIDVAMASAALISFNTMQSASTVLFGNFGSLYYYLNKAKNLFKILDFEEENLEKNKYEGKSELCVEIKNGVFSYPNSDYQVIKNLSLSFGKNEVIALVGENGCGKTSLSKILMGLYRLNKGTILYNDSIIEKEDSDSLFKSIAYVPQILPKFNMSIREFLNIGIKNILSESEIKNVFEELNMQKFQNELDSLLGKEFGGIELSGGEWQKLFITQSILRSAEIFIYDEATSAIDPLHESFILDNILKTVKNHASLIITHRLAICPYVDRIIVMNKGEIVEIGTHNELIAKKGYYNKMYMIQSELLTMQEVNI